MQIKLLDAVTDSDGALHAHRSIELPWHLWAPGSTRVHAMEGNVLYHLKAARAEEEASQNDTSPSPLRTACGASSLKQSLFHHAQRTKLRCGAALDPSALLAAGLGEFGQTVERNLRTHLFCMRLAGAPVSDAPASRSTTCGQSHMVLELALSA